jgi:hypothetical protein
MVEAGLKAQGQKAHKHQEKEDIATGKGQQHKPQPRQHRPDHHHYPGIKPVNEIPNQRAFQGGLEPGQGKRQGRGRPTEVQLGENRQKIQCEAGVKCATLHRILDAADDHNPPAIKEAVSAWRARALGLWLLHYRLACFLVLKP